MAEAPEGACLTIGNMPVYWRIRRDTERPHSGIPPLMDLILEFDCGLGLLRQAMNDERRGVLEAIYLAESNIGYLQEGHTLAQGYGSDLLAHLGRKMAGRAWQRVIEIGCGGCYMLARLQSQGKSVVGVDPTPIAQLAGARMGIKVIPDFFPPAALLEPADLILHSDVLEHVEDPVGFLAAHRPYLRDEGVLLAAVPDCTQSIALGDISMLLHQHLSYFSAHSLRSVVETAGFGVLDIAQSGYGGSLYCLAAKSSRSSAASAPAALDAMLGADPSFIARTGSTLERMRKRIGQDGAGYYMPLRAIPYLSALGVKGHRRFFDDTAHWHYGCIDGTEVRIENFADLAANPPDVVHVMSLTFGDLVAAKIRGRLPAVRARTLQELLEP